MTEIYFQDEHLLIVNKPAGIPVLPDGWTPDAPFLRQMLEESFGKIFVVHRLDKVTSGVMIFARTPEAHRHLNTQFEQHSVAKVYHVIVEGSPNWQEKICKMPLRVNVGKKHRTMVDHGKGLAAETRFTVLARGKAHSLLEARPKTGRTHQIRVHAYALGHPLMGDVLYSATATRLTSRPALHALSIQFIHPVLETSLQFESPYPEDFQQLVRHLNL